MNDRFASRLRFASGCAAALLALAPVRLHAQTPAGPSPPAAQGAQTLPGPGAPAIPPPAQPAQTTPVSPGAAAAPSLQPAPPAGRPGPGRGLPPPSAAPSEAASIGNDVVLEHADRLSIDETTGVITATGHVLITYRGYLLSADQASLNTDTGEAMFSGSISLRSPDTGTHAESIGPNGLLKLNLRSGAYDLLGGEKATISPSELPASGLILPLRLFGGEISGDSHVIDARNAQITTCDFPTPHYAFGARSMTIVPGKYLVLRRVTLYRKDHPIITVPWFWMSLSDRYARQGLTPMVGYSQQEGYFAKFAYPYVLAATALGVMRLDLMQYEGVGLGIDQNYLLHTDPALSSQGGSVQVYHLYNTELHDDTLTGTWTHNQRVGDGFQLSTNNQYENDSYYNVVGTSDTLSSQTTLDRNTRDATTDLSMNWQQNSIDGETSSNLSASWFQHEVLSQYSHIDFKFAYAGISSSGDGFSTGNQSLTTTVDFVDHPKGYTFEAQIDKFSSLGVSGAGANPNELSGVQRLPELTLTSDPSTGAGQSLLDRLLPKLTKLMLDVGEFSEEISGIHTNRLEFGFDLGNHTDRRGDLTTTYTGSFQQYFYGDSTAQYILAGQSGWQYAFQKLSSVSIKYSYLRPYGYTPFFFDRSGFYNNATTTLDYQPYKAFQFSAGTGFDITRDQDEPGLPAAPWENLLAQVTFKPTNDFGDRLMATYDPNHGQLYDVTDYIQARSKSGFSFNSSALYVPQEKEFSEIDSSLDLPIIVDKNEDAGYRIQAMEGYNGYTDTFSYEGLALTRSWHDWELSAIYEYIPNGIEPGTTFYLNLRLKAFPGYQPFGTGAFGQALGSGVGEVL